jgi:hypothetical protein
MKSCNYNNSNPLKVGGGYPQPSVENPSHREEIGVHCILMLKSIFDGFTTKLNISCNLICKRQLRYYGEESIGSKL